MTQPDPQGAHRVTARERLIYRVRAVNARLRDKTGSDIDPAIWLDDLDAIEAEAIAANNAALAERVRGLAEAHQIGISYGYEEVECSCGWRDGFRDYSQPEGDQWVERDWQDDHFVPLVIDLLERKDPA